MARHRNDPVRRWALPDRTFFGHGACHILAGMFLRLHPNAGFIAKRIIPKAALPGAHIIISNDLISFDYHGYCVESRLIQHHTKVWRKQCVTWDADIELVDFDLLNTTALNHRKMLGPDQYWRDVLPRARAFIERIDHKRSYQRAFDRL